MAEEGGSDGKVVSSACSSSAAHASRSRCFKVYKYALILSLVLFLVLVLVSTPWMPPYVRDILNSMNTTTVALNYSGAESFQFTDVHVYGIIASSLIATAVYVLFGVFVLYKECFYLIIVFGIVTLAAAIATICCASTHVAALVTMIIEFALVPVILLFAVLIKRADRLAPESSQKLTNEEETTDSLKKKKQKPESDDADPDNVKI